LSAIHFPGPGREKVFNAFQSFILQRSLHFMRVVSSDALDLRSLGLVAHRICRPEHLYVMYCTLQIVRRASADFLGTAGRKTQQSPVPA
jgi:hypothetical protein